MFTSSKYEWKWNNSHQSLSKRPKNIIKKNTTVAFYSKKEQLYLEIDSLNVGLGASLLQVRGGMWFLRYEAPGNAAL